jgi:hypothetical protein
LFVGREFSKRLIVYSCLSDESFQNVLLLSWRRAKELQRAFNPHFLNAPNRLTLMNIWGSLAPMLLLLRLALGQRTKAPRLLKF